MKKRLLICLLCILMIFSFVFSYDNEKMQNEVVSYQYKTENKLEKNNNDLLDRIDRLEGLAEEYIIERGIDANATELCLQYLRKDRYNDEKWRGLMGPIDGTFVKYVEEHDPDLKFSTHEVFYDLGTNRVVDFVHMAAVLNSYVRYGDTISLIITDLSTDYAGWAGDMLTFLEEIVNYRIENQPEGEELEYESDESYAARIEDIQQHAISLLGTNAESTMSGSDVFADFDAYNIYSDSGLKVKESLTDALTKYYKTFESNHNANNRFTVLKKRFGDTELSITNTLRPYFDNLVVRNLFIPETTDKVTEDDIKVVSKAFAQYILGYIYIDIVPVEEDAIVGKEVKIKIIENHLDLATVTINPPEIATAKISGEYLVVQPIEAGEAYITVASLGGSASKSYTLKIVNVPPNITKGLDSNYYFRIDENETLELEAEGTNNVYTWYMSNALYGDYTVLAETSSPTYVLTPTADMDGKYLKCGVKNKGNEEIESNVTILVVSGSRVEEVVRKNNVLIIVLVVVLLLLVLLVLVYFKVIKGTSIDPFNKNVVYVTVDSNGNIIDNGTVVQETPVAQQYPMNQQNLGEQQYPMNQQYPNNNFMNDSNNSNNNQSNFF